VIAAALKYSSDAHIPACSCSNLAQRLGVVKTTPVH